MSERRPVPPGAPGVLMTGILLLPAALLLNPWLLGRMWPDLFAARPGWWWPALGAHVLLLYFTLRFMVSWRSLGQTWCARFVFVRAGFLGGALLSLLALLALAAVLEVVFWRLDAFKARGAVATVKDQYMPSMYMPDPWLALRARPNEVCEHRAILRPSGEEIFDKRYTLDEHGHRRVPQPEGEKAFHLATFGCSLTFGIGVNDEETWPSLVAGHWPEAHVYNFAFGSYGPGHTYLQLVNDVTDIIEEPQGAAIYLLMSDHVNRLLPRIRYATMWTRKFPAFLLSSTGEARYYGSLDTAYPGWLRFLDVVSREKFVKWSGLDFPAQPAARDYELCVAILAGAREEYRRRFPGNEFYVLLDPVCFKNFDYEAIVSSLLARGVPFLNARGTYGDDPWSKHYPVEGHPRPVANRALSSWLVEQFPDGPLAPPKAQSR